VILVDTSVWIDFFNGFDSAEAAHLRLCIADVRPLTIPGLVLTEILIGLRTEAEANRVARVLSAFDVTPELDSTDYQKAAELYRACRRHGRTIRSTIDCLIAQLCLRYSYELLAKDQDFDSIAEVFPLQRAAGALRVHDRPRATTAGD
jgi:predicted nucleic acid-binding protein